MPYIHALEEWDEIIGEKWTRPESLYLNPSHWIRENEIHRQFMKRTRELVDDSFGRLEMFKHEHSSILTMFWRNSNSEIQKLADPKLLEQAVVYEETVKSFTKLAEILKQKLVIKADMGIYLVDCTNLSEVLIGRHGQLFKEICELFVSIVRERATALKTWYLQAIRSLTSLILQIDEFVEQKNSLDKVQNQLPKIK